MNTLLRPKSLQPSLYSPRPQLQSWDQNSSLPPARCLGHCQQLDVHLQCSYFVEAGCLHFFGIFQEPCLPSTQLCWLFPGYPRVCSVSGPGAEYFSCSLTLPGRPGGQRLTFTPRKSSVNASGRRTFNRCQLFLGISELLNYVRHRKASQAQTSHTCSRSLPGHSSPVFRSQCKQLTGTVPTLHLLQKQGLLVGLYIKMSGKAQHSYLLYKEVLYNEIELR